MNRFFAIFLTGVILLTACGVPKGEYTSFATCIADSGAQFYGAFWCPHCKEQKELFGDAAAQLPYVECAQGGENAQVQRCLDEKVESYPTWKFANGTARVGKLTLEELAEQTNCALNAEDQSVMRQ